MRLGLSGGTYAVLACCVTALILGCGGKSGLLFEQSQQEMLDVHLLLTTALRPGEILTQIRVPILPPRVGSACW